MYAVLVITFLWILMGVACGWWFWGLGGGSKDSNPWSVAAATLSTGFVLLLLAAWVLIEFGQFRLSMFIPVCMTISGVGGFPGFYFHRERFLQLNRILVRPILLFGFLALLMIFFAPTSKWIAGGWDPGVYINQGIFNVHTSGGRADTDQVFKELSQVDFNPFMNEVAGRVELFPGIPLDPESGEIRPTFYPLTPAWISTLYLFGGVDAVFLAMPLLALLLLFVLAGGLRAVAAPPVLVFCALILLCLQPLFLYHAHTPCSEMMEMLFVGMLLFMFPRRDHAFPLFFCALLLPAGLLNRPTFLIWITLFFPIRAFSQPLSLSRSLVLSIPVLLGILYYLTGGHSSLDRISHLFPMLAGAALISVYLSAFAGPLLHRITWKRFPAFFFLLTPLALLILTLLVHPNVRSEWVLNVKRMIPYIGWPMLLLAAAGFSIRLKAVWRTGRLEALDAWFLLCICASTLPLIFKFAADLYPWATKRSLSSLPFSTTLGAAIALCESSKIPRWPWPRLVYAPALAGILVVGIWQGSRLPQAWFHIEYEGMPALMASIAGELSPEDIVLADHFLWATPLTMIYQRNALNGEPLWASETNRRTRAAWAFLREQQESGRRIFLLSSTDRGPDLFPAPLNAGELLRTFPPHRYSVIAHHRNGSGFLLRDKTANFRLYRCIIPPHPPLSN